LLILSTQIMAGELTHDFNSPAFSGQGYGNHVLTIDQLEHQRKKEIRDKREADAAKAKREAEGTVLAKFLNNLESRIYASLSKQMVDNMFSSTGATSGSVDIEGATIVWSKDLTTDMITLQVTETGGSVTTVTVPIGTFGF